MTGSLRIGVTDVHYPADGGAYAALVVYSDARCCDPTAEFTTFVADVAPYRPGHFRDRELPPLRAVLALAGPLDLLVVDGYVYLDGAGRPGLGAYLHDETGLPVVGIAKTAFRGADHAEQVLRGRSAKPLLVTAAGVPAAGAAAFVAALAGPDRLPVAVRRADRLCRDHARPRRDGLSPGADSRGSSAGRRSP